MKKLYLIFISLSLTILFLGCGKIESNRYSSKNDGSDTIESFGEDGHFGIFKISPEGNLHLDLYDAKDSGSIDFISDYKEIKPYVYTIGKKGYIKLNYEDSTIIQSNNLDKFSDEDKEIFNRLK
ncbi:hypothetical protein [Clostridium tarantellae]|uniref:Lipoprotein n=1 Tax=Clostridium tarantellae TaxID=39493 RepID=A0A6I1MTK8_9CLOT|nr:hypothetical protein [Clostridium tarantellae]MPQ44211.1 hypothetical protein [Clostridium tarantellae]